MVQVDFNELPRATRDRFVRSLASTAPTSAPLCSKTEKKKSSAPLLALLLLSFLGFGGIGYFRFASPTQPVHDKRFIAAYVADALLFSTALWTLMRRRAVAGSLPFKPGIYVFPTDVVDARTRELTLYPLSEITSIELAPNEKLATIWVAFQDQSFSFDVPEIEGETIKNSIVHAKNTFSSALHRNAMYELLGLDPFSEARERNFTPVHEHGLLAREPAFWTKIIWLLVIVTGGGIGYGAWRGRNFLSDKRAYDRLAKNPDPALAKAYLDAGGRRASDIQLTILPRAAFEKAKKEEGQQKKLEAFEKFFVDFPQSTIEAEVRSAFNEALHTEFQFQKTAAGLRAFMTRWPKAPDVSAAKSKTHQLYMEALGDFRRQSNPGDKNVVPVMEAILLWADTHPAPLDVRLRRSMAGQSGRPTSLTQFVPPPIDSADKLLAKGLLDDDGKSVPGVELGPFLANDKIAAREAAIVKGLEQAFKRVFPGDLIPLRRGAPLEEGKSVDAVDAPTIALDYDIAWSGQTYVARDRAKRYLGMSIKVELSIHVPKDKHVISIEYKVESPDATTGIAADGDEGYYDALLASTVERGGNKVVSALLESKIASSRQE